MRIFMIRLPDLICTRRRITITLIHLTKILIPILRTTILHSIIIIRILRTTILHSIIIIRIHHIITSTVIPPLWTSATIPIIMQGDLNMDDEIELRIKLQSQFKCLRCGDCCQRMQVMTIRDEELPQVAQFLGITLEEFKERYVGIQRNGSLTLRQMGPCIFFDAGRGCTIQPVKFQSCRSWPFLDSALIGKPLGTYFGSCPGQYEMVKHLERYL